jgi:hypothetical protein
MSNCLHLEQQGIMDQSHLYHSSIKKTLEHINNNDGVVLRMEQRAETFRSMVTETRKDLANLANIISHLQKDSSLYFSELT